MEKIICISINCLFWNVRGLGNPAKRRMVEEVIHTNKIDIICLEETKLTDPDPGSWDPLLPENFSIPVS